MAVTIESGVKILTLVDIVEWREGQTVNIPEKSILAKPTPTTEAEHFTSVGYDFDIVCRLTDEEKEILYDIEDDLSTVTLTNPVEGYTATCWIERIKPKFAYIETDKYRPWLTAIHLVMVGVGWGVYPPPPPPPPPEEEFILWVMNVHRETIESIEDLVTLLSEYLNSIVPIEDLVTLSSEYLNTIVPIEDLVTLLSEYLNSIVPIEDLVEPSSEYVVTNDPISETHTLALSIVRSVT